VRSRSPAAPGDVPMGSPVYHCYPFDRMSLYDSRLSDRARRAIARLRRIVLIRLGRKSI